MNDDTAMMKWDQHLRQFGRVTFRTSRLHLAFAVVVIVGSCAFGLWLGVRQAGDVDARSLWLTTAMIASIEVFLLALMWQSNLSDQVVIDLERIRLAPNVMIQHQEVTGARRYRGRSSKSTVELTIANDAFERVNAQFPVIIRFLNRFNSAFKRRKVVYLPNLEGVDTGDLADWLTYLHADRMRG